ncbi:MAG: SDR family NAD(P)-dependent oxidoreductase [Dehalococcoidia bacterium]
MDLELAGKTALITGGSRGIGKAIARHLAREGVAVAIAARGRDALEETAQELAQETGQRIVPIQGDTSDDDSVHNMVERSVAELGQLDILVNNAGWVARPSPTVEELTNEEFFDDVNVKVVGYIRCAREAAPYLKKQGWGRIINISGGSARSTGSYVHSIRNVSVVALTKNLADELGPQGINVTCVIPGTIRTERFDEIIESRARVRGVSPEEVVQTLVESVSIRRVIDSQDIANIVTFLASPKSIAINGDVVPATGGGSRAIYY